MTTEEILRRSEPDRLPPLKLADNGTTDYGPLAGSFNNDRQDRIGFRARGGYAELHPEPHVSGAAHNTVSTLAIATTRYTAFLSVDQERDRQEAKWGQHNHDSFTGLAILGEEVGEANQAALQDRFGGKHAGTFREELVHVAAVALAMIEKLDREGYEAR